MRSVTIALLFIVSGCAAKTPPAMTYSQISLRDVRGQCWIMTIVGPGDGGPRQVKDLRDVPCEGGIVSFHDWPPQQEKGK